jgi:hypothetical protein|tara:strand:- start:828 stop:1160 length:333 start_codon:yes stop_codon:yes gene_type:complete
MPKADYFRMRLQNAIDNGLTRKANYYRSRLAEMGEQATKQATKPVTQADKDSLKARVAAKSPHERVAIAVKIIRDGEEQGFPVQNVMRYLTSDCGLTTEEYLEALHAATA